ncbi:baeRF2 domain-containing protein [Streptomyces odontomachi]|uniref:baeRF2 domain-containing protein n=1 Tax=Streptomyces odontomachi TaxID=2944940 RepID=UPI00210C9208|nr:Vms1/Ankzf1 family peptidyl-tRNA hydrolase [Streptomyces sp. ODS25]
MDLTYLRALYEGEAPVASVHLDTTRATHDADRLIDTRWRSARRSLAGQGAGEDTLGALDAVVGGVGDLPGPQGEALFASAGQVLGTYTMAAPPPADQARYLPVPDPLLVAFDRDHQVPHVVVAVDREGADVDAYPAAAHEPAFRRTFNGSTLHISRVRAGAEAQASFHRRTASVWGANTARAAEDVRDAVAAVEAEVILVAGDPKAFGLLREHLAPMVSCPLVQVGGGRTDASARAALRSAADQALREVMAANHADALRQLGEALAGDRALQGIPAVKEALSQGRVQTLFLAPVGTEDESLLYASQRDRQVLGSDATVFGDDPTVFSAPARPLLLRSAVLGGASFTEILPPVRCTDGVAALLRH